MTDIPLHQNHSPPHHRHRHRRRRTSKDARNNSKNNSNLGGGVINGSRCASDGSSTTGQGLVLSSIPQTLTDNLDEPPIRNYYQSIQQPYGYHNHNHDLDVDLNLKPAAVMKKINCDNTNTMDKNRNRNRNRNSEIGTGTGILIKTNRNRRVLFASSSSNSSSSLLTSFFNIILTITITLLISITQTLASPILPLSNVSPAFLPDSSSSSSPTSSLAESSLPACTPTKKSHKPGALFGIEAALIPILVILSGIFAGLTLGYMSLDSTQLQVLAKSGNKKQREAAEKIIPIRKDGHLLLTTLLLANMIVNETLPVISDSVLGGGIQAVVVSTVLIVIFAEIIPQSVCSRFGLQIGAVMAWPTRILMYIFFIVAWPVAKFLHILLGPHHGIVYRRAELKELINMHGGSSGNGGDLDKDTITIVGATLDLQEKTVRDAMTKIQDVFMLDFESRLDYETLTKVLKSGHSRIPVFEDLIEVLDNDGNGNGDEVVTEKKKVRKRREIKKVMLTKNFILVDPEDAIPLRSVPVHPLPVVADNLPLLNILNTFQEGRSHMAVVHPSIRDHPSGLGGKNDDLMVLDSIVSTTTSGKDSKDREKNGNLNGHGHGDKESSESGSSSTSTSKEKNHSSSLIKRFFNKRRGGSKSSSSGGDEESGNETTTTNATTSDGGVGDGANAAEEGRLKPSSWKPDLNAQPIGIITLENVLEELIGEEIYDETDRPVGGGQPALDPYIPPEAAAKLKPKSSSSSVKKSISSNNNNNNNKTSSPLSAAFRLGRGPSVTSTPDLTPSPLGKKPLSASFSPQTQTSQTATATPVKSFSADETRKEKEDNQHQNQSSSPPPITTSTSTAAGTDINHLPTTPLKSGPVVGAIKMVRSLSSPGRRRSVDVVVPSSNNKEVVPKISEAEKTSSAGILESPVLLSSGKRSRSQPPDKGQGSRSRSSIANLNADNDDDDDMDDGLETRSEASGDTEPYDSADDDDDDDGLVGRKTQGSGRRRRRSLDDDQVPRPTPRPRTHFLDQESPSSKVARGRNRAQQQQHQRRLGPSFSDAVVGNSGTQIVAPTPRTGTTGTGTGGGGGFGALGDAVLLERGRRRLIGQGIFKPDNLPNLRLAPTSSSSSSFGGGWSSLPTSRSTTPGPTNTTTSGGGSNAVGLVSGLGNDPNILVVPPQVSPTSGTSTPISSGGGGLSSGNGGIGGGGSSGGGGGSLRSSYSMFKTPQSTRPLPIRGPSSTNMNTSTLPSFLSPTMASPSFDSTNRAVGGSVSFAGSSTPSGRTVTTGIGSSPLTNEFKTPGGDKDGDEDEDGD